MQELYEGIELTDEQTEWICLGLLDLAAVDGVHESELALIEDFYCAGDPERKADLDAMRKQKLDLEKATKVFNAGGENVVEAFLVSSFLLIYADGEHSDAERMRIHEFGDALNVDAAKLEDLHTKARLYLLDTLARTLRNREAVKYVAQSMGLADDQIAKTLEG